MARPFKPINDKLKLLKDIATGKQPLSKIGKSNHYVVFVHGEEGKDERTYEIDRKEYNQQEYEQWKESIDDEATILHFIQIVDNRGYINGNAPLDDEDRPPIVVPVEVKVMQLPEEKEIPQKKTEPCVEAVIEPKLIRYEDHVRYNQMIFDKLFS